MSQVIQKHEEKAVRNRASVSTHMVKELLAGKQPIDKLFPRLDRKKTWLMVKKDLEQAGIEYETEDGIADFRAAGRHTHITQLLRNGATLAEARELARHSDVRMTMRYTHIGLDDQARALASLPSPKQHPAKTAEPNSQAESASSQQTSQHSIGPDRQMGLKRGKTWQAAKKNPEASSTASSGTYDASGQCPAESGTDSAQWRRRESNAEFIYSNERAENELGILPSSCAASGECAEGSACLHASADDTSAYVLAAWPKLPPHVREAILTLVDAGLGGGGEA